MATIRTGKASPALLDRCDCRCLRIQDAVKPAQFDQLYLSRALLVVQPWDKGMIGPIEKAIQISDLGLTPSNDGNVIRLPIPALNEERRKDLVKLVHKLVETGRISVRHARKEANDELKQALKDSAHLGG